MRYRGYYYDNETGFYYLLSRYYDPVIGRFVNSDGEMSGVGGAILGYNMFAYCFNNPVNMTDPMGNMPKWAKIALGVAVATVGTAATMYAADVAYSSVTGDSPLRDTIFNGNQEAYDTGLLLAQMGTGVVMDMALSSPGVCFAAGTQVSTKRGLVPIEEIAAGEFVWAFNPKTGEKGLKKVVQTFEKQTDELLHVSVNGEEIITTPEHPFYAPSKGWIKAIHLRAGDALILQNDKYVIVEMVQHEILEAPMTVYNFEVEDFHTYYVGESSVLVHNECGPKKQETYETRKQAFNAAKRDLGVPRSQQPIVRPNIGNDGKVVPSRVYDFGQGRIIRDDIMGHTFSDGATMGKHFNTPSGLHIFYER